MNNARWVLAYTMIEEKDRRFLRRMARLLGTDLDVVEKGDAASVEFGSPVRAFPLAGLLNAETYDRFIKTAMEEGELGEASTTADAEYERQINAMEKDGLLSDIDILGAEADKRGKDAKNSDLEKFGILEPDQEWTQNK